MNKHKPILLLFVLIMLWSASAHAGWWDSSDQRRIDQLQGQLEWEQKKDDGQGIAICVLAVGTILALGIGAAVGSRTRRHAARSHEQ